MRLNFRSALALALAGSVAITGVASAQLRGTAELAITPPSTKIVGKEVVTTMKVRNLSKQSIAGLRVEEYWFDKAGNPAPGGSRRLNRPLAPDAVIALELRTPRTAGMEKNSYQFTHQYGKVNTRVVAKIE